MPITFGSLFAGIGGFDLGFERAGMQCKWQVEIDDYATKVLEKHWPNVHRERDIRECGKHNLETVDVICGGFPCQDISCAGKGAGLSGERSGLFYEAMRVVREVGPKVVVLENVAALLTRGLDEVLGELASLGYDAEWSSVEAAAFGLPHHRQRVFVVAYTVGSMQQGVVFPKSIFVDQKESRRRELARAVNASVPADDYASMRGDYPGVSTVMDRLRCLGNAVVPQVAEYIGHQIKECFSQGGHYD